MRKVGPARTPGDRDGLTKSQAEERFRKMRGAEQPRTPTDRATIAEAGERALATPQYTRAQEVSSDDRRFRPPQPTLLLSSGGPSSTRSSTRHLLTSVET